MGAAFEEDQKALVVLKSTSGQSGGSMQVGRKTELGKVQHCMMKLMDSVEGLLARAADVSGPLGHRKGAGME